MNAKNWETTTLFKVGLEARKKKSLEIQELRKKLIQRKSLLRSRYERRSENRTMELRVKNSLSKNARDIRLLVQRKITSGRGSQTKSPNELWGER